jgi:hypothetical protein
LVELATNYNFFTDSPIESSREKGMDAAERYREGTTELAKLIGKAGVASPVQVEHLVRGYMSSAGILFMSMANYPLRPFVSSDLAELPEKPLNRMSLFGPAFQPDTGRGAIDEAYADAERFEMASNTFNKMIDEGRRSDAQAYAQQFAREIALASTGGMFTQQMGEFAEMKRLVAASREMTPAQKREKIDQIRKAEILFARRIRELSRGDAQ